MQRVDPFFVAQSKPPLMGVKGYFKEFMDTYNPQPQVDPGAIQRAMKFRQQEKERVSALADEHNELTIMNQRLQQRVKEQEDWIINTNKRLEYINSKLQMNVSNRSRRSGGAGTSSLRPEEAEDPGPEMRVEEVPTEGISDDAARQEGPLDVRQRDTGGSDDSVRSAVLQSEEEPKNGEAVGRVPGKGRGNRRVVIRESEPSEDTSGGVQPPPEPVGEERDD